MLIHLTCGCQASNTCDKKVKWIAHARLASRTELNLFRTALCRVARTIHINSPTMFDRPATFALESMSWAPTAFHGFVLFGMAVHVGAQRFSPASHGHVGTLSACQWVHLVLGIFCWSWWSPTHCSPGEAVMGLGLKATRVGQFDAVGDCVLCCRLF